MIEMTTTNYYCSDLAIERGEQLFGTATRVDAWLLLSYAAPFGRKAYDESEIPEPVKQHLNAAVRTSRNTRIQLIRRQNSTLGSLTFYVALSKELGSVLYELEFGSYDELLDLDLGAVIAGDPRYEEYLSEEPVFLVCTNGMHDRCCARAGMPVYTHMAARGDVKVWQTSHVGGHRFAANVVCLPHGIIFGRLSPANVTDVVAGYLSQSVRLDKYRGRSCHDAPVQAADYFLRADLGILDIDGLRFLQAQQVDENNVQVFFLSTPDGKTHMLHVARDPGAIHTFTSCGASKASDIDQFRLIDHRIIA
jgi:hypothetical protein